MDEAILKRLLPALRANGMEAIWAPNRDAALSEALSLIEPGDTVGVGGSVTLEEIGLIEALRKGRPHPGEVNFYDQYAPGLAREDSIAMRRKSLTADIFFSGANAVTMSGELVNMDGYGNRVAALAFGPQRVCIVAGINKIVPDIPAALERIRTVAAPLNCRRLNRATPCRNNGLCDDAGCGSPDRICNIYSVIRRKPGGAGFTAIIVGEKLGF